MNEANPRASARDRAPADDEVGRREALSADERTRREAALALVDSATDGLEQATVEALVERVHEDPSPDVRQFAVEALGEAGTGVQAIEAALEDPDEWVRAEAVVALSRAAPERTERLQTVLEDDEAGMVRRNAVVALGKREAASWDRLVDRLKSDPHPAVREYAAQYLSDTDGPEDDTVRLLAAVLAREQNAFVRVKAAEGLGDLGTDRAIEALETQGLEDRSDDVQRTSRHALARARGQNPEDLADDLPDPAAPGGGPDSPRERETGHRGGRSGRGPGAGAGSGPLSGARRSSGFRSSPPDDSTDGSESR